MKIFLTFFTFLLFTKVICAQWQQTNGPEGGTVLSIASIGSNIYAGMDSEGIFVSTNNGASWTKSNNGLNDLSVSSIKSIGAKILAGTASGVDISFDNGATWNGTNLHSMIMTLHIDGNEIFAGTYGNGAFLSTDSGNTWNSISTGLSGFYVSSITTSGSNIFAGTDVGMFLSSNNGVSWIAINNGLLNTQIISLIANGNSIYASTGGGLYVTTNNGSSWNSTGMHGGFLCMAINGSDFFGGSYYGLYYSNDSGLSWSHIGLEITVNCIDINGGNLYLGTSGRGVFSSINNGNNWTEINTGIIKSNVTHIFFNGPDILAATPTGLFLSSNSGLNYVLDTIGLGYNNIYSFASDNTKIVAGTDHGVFLSTNNGSSWINVGLTNFIVLSSLIIGQNIFAGTNNGGIFLSDNNGNTWTPVNSGLINYDITSLISDGTNIYAGTYGGGVHITTNNGINWTPINNGLLPFARITLAMRGDTLFAGSFSNNGLYYTTNNGANWSLLGLSTERIRTLVVNDSYIFAMTFNGLFASADNGSTWNLFNTGLINNYCIQSMAISGNYIYAGTNSYGVWKRNLSDLTPIQKVPENGLIAVYQNLNSGNLIIDFYKYYSAIEVSLFDMSGKNAFTDYIEKANLISINTKHLISGIYVLIIRSNGINESKIIELNNRN